MAFRQQPYQHHNPIRVMCVANRTCIKTLNFQMVECEIRPGTQTVSHQSALSDGAQVYLTQPSQDRSSFEEGMTYFIKGFTLSFRNGQQRLFLGSKSIIYRTTPISLTEEQRRHAREALVPPSCMMNGEEQDLFSRGGYLSLQGVVESFQVPRMTTVREVPILDFTLKCCPRVLDVSFWRDQAMTELHLNQTIKITHLKASIRGDYNCKLNSTSYTTIEVLEQGPLVEDIKVIAVSVVNEEVLLLTDDFSNFTAPVAILERSVEDLLGLLPIHLRVTPKNKIVQELHYLKNE